MARTGRPPTAIDPKQVEKLAAVLSQDQLADYFGLKARGLRDRLSKNAELLAAYKKGRAVALFNVGGTLLNSAIAGNTAAQIFYLKTQGGWREPRDTDTRDLTVVVDVATQAARLRREIAELDRRDGVDP